MNKLQTLHRTIHMIMNQYVYIKTKNSLSFNEHIPYLSKSESDLLNYICTTHEIKPVLYLSKKTNDFSDILGLYIPSEHSYYIEMVKHRSNFSRIKDSLIDKRVLFETPYGFLLNHKMIPFTSNAVMKYLSDFSKVPLPPNLKWLYLYHHVHSMMFLFTVFLDKLKQNKAGTSKKVPLFYFLLLNEICMTSFVR